MAIAGITWFERENYAACRAVMVDDVLPADYELWRRRAEAQMLGLEMLEFRTVKIVLDAAAFVAWCETNGHAPDAKARERFTDERVQKFVYKG
jgi:hypothetical protein